MRIHDWVSRRILGKRGRLSAVRCAAAAVAFCMALSLLSGAFSFFADAVQASSDDGAFGAGSRPMAMSSEHDGGAADASGESRDEVRERLLREVLEGVRNPFDGSMPVDEFYILMELFECGALSFDGAVMASYAEVFGLGSENIRDGGFQYDVPAGVSAYGPDYDGAPVSGPSVPEPVSDGISIPRTMFLFGGLPEGAMPGSDGSDSFGPPLDYDSMAGCPDEPDDYPAGLDAYGRGYRRPPLGWEGVRVGERLEVTLIVPGVNDGDVTVSGDVDQSLFLGYDGYYVRRVSVRNDDVVVLGVISLPWQDSYVCYYMTKAGQSTDVSAMVLGDGEKFVVEYSLVEHGVWYQVRMDSVDGDDVTEEWVDVVFGTDRPDRSNRGDYAFSATAPYGYKASFYLMTRSDGGWSEPSLQLGRIVDGRGAYEDVNGGWALGEEPVYSDNRANSGFKVLANADIGPASMIRTGTFSNSDVTEDHMVIAVLHEKPEPTFSVVPIRMNLAGVSGRGSTASESYDWEADFNYSYHKLVLGESDADNPYPNPYPSGRPNGGHDFPNIASLMSGRFDWSVIGSPMEMERVVKRNPDGSEDVSYSYSWMFQTNSPSNGFYLDAFEVNGIGIKVPFYPKYVWPSYHGDETPGTTSGVKSWIMESTLPDGTVVVVEYLLVFGNTQRHYRITVRDAKDDVTINGMNLNMYLTGSPEFSVYDLDGVTGATKKAGAHSEAVQYYDISGRWSENVYRENVVISAISYVTGDVSTGGANFRFKLADGYGSPYYLYESARDGVISGQSSILRGDDGSVDVSTQNPVLPYISDGSDVWMAYDETGLPVPVTSGGGRLYDADGNPFTDWQSIRVRIEEHPGGGQEAPSAERVLMPALYASPDGGERLGADDVIAPAGACVFDAGPNPDTVMRSQYIYRGAEGWHYIRVFTQESYKIALLTVIARPERYVVRYKPGIIPAVYDSEGALQADETYPEWMPEYEHLDSCPSFLQGWHPDRPSGQFDDNAGLFYDVDVYATAAVSAVSPVDPNGNYRFVDWVLVDEYDEPVKAPVTRNGEWVPDGYGGWLMDEVHFSSGSSFDIGSYCEFAILNDDMGSIDVDLYVFRLKPTWDKAENPFSYSVALNWLDAGGNLHETLFDEYWSKVLTSYDPVADGSNGFAVKVLTWSVPFQDWIAEHPTYSFWDDVNNATSVEEIEAALVSYFPELLEGDDDVRARYGAAFAALTDMDVGVEDGSGTRVKDGLDDFARLGNYVYAVLQDDGTIVIWMHEAMGSMLFHADVAAEPFVCGDEFFFTVECEDTLTGSSALNGDYKAYPETVYDELTGAERRLRDSDAWIATFEDGKLVKVTKNDGSRESSGFFSLRDGEGILLRVPAGRYTVREVRSGSGGAYRVNVSYRDDGIGLPHMPDWYFPEMDSWLGSGRIEATVSFGAGEEHSVRTVVFLNMTSSVAFEKHVEGSYGGELFGFGLTLLLPSGVEPLFDEEGDYHYFDFNLYDVSYDGSGPVRSGVSVGSSSLLGGAVSPVCSGRLVVSLSDEGSNGWSGSRLLVYDGNAGAWTELDSPGGLRLGDGQRFCVVCVVPDDGSEINYRVEETDSGPYFVEGGSVREGSVGPAELAYERFVNSVAESRPMLPVTGGYGVSYLPQAVSFVFAAGIVAFFSRRRTWEG